MVDTPRQETPSPAMISHAFEPTFKSPRMSIGSLHQSTPISETLYSLPGGYVAAEEKKHHPQLRTNF
jgi:hypothetical protein